MKIQSTSHRRTKIKLGGKIVEFDAKGCAEMDEELFDKYKSIGLFEFGKVPTTQSQKESDSDPKIQALREENAKLRGIIETKNNSIKEAKEAEKVWRNKLEEVLKEKEGAIESAKAEIGKVDEVEDLRKQLDEMHVKQLPKYMEELGIDKSLFAHLKTKQDLVDFVINFINNK